MPKFLMLFLIPFFVQSQCDDGEYEILVETYSGEWAEEMSWFIINNDGENVFYDGSNAENDTEYSQNICLSAGCYAFEAIDSYGDGWNGGYAEITALNNDVEFSVPELVIQLNGGP